jgi:hypothetical protein
MSKGPARSTLRSRGLLRLLTAVAEVVVAAAAEVVAAAGVDEEDAEDEAATRG